MLKKIVISLVVVLVLAVGAVFFYIDSIVKSGIEVVGSQVLGTNVSVASVSLSPLSGAGSISGLRIANPEGFNSEHAITLEQVEVALDTGSLFSDVIEISSITVAQPQITYETRITTDNIRALLNNIPAGSGNGGDQQGAAESGKGLVIRELLIDDPQLNLVAAVVSAPIPLPDIEMSDIGADDESATPAEVLREVLGSLNSAILAANLPNLDELREGLENRLQEGVQEVESAVEDATDEVRNRLRSILN